MTWARRWALLQALMRWMVTDMTGRRQFLGGLLAAGLSPNPTWADAGSPAFISAAMKPDGSFVLCGIRADLQIGFMLPLPARGHAAAVHPIRPEAVAFARRPGTFAVIVDCVTGQQKAILRATAGRHFYGHGVFSLDGSRLYTTENDYESGQGRIGVWDTRRGYRRIDEWDSGGIGPHDIKRLPDTETLVVANGGIDTHPDTGRTKLNIPTMQPNLAYVADGAVIAVATLCAEMHKNSIRHLAVDRQGQVAFGMQWQGAGRVDALVGVHRIGSAVKLMKTAAVDLRGLRGYVGSIAFSPDGHTVAVTSPRGGVLQLYTASTRTLAQTITLPDVCGVAAFGQTITATTGTGTLVQMNATREILRRKTDVQWDNHLIPLA